MDIKLAQAPGEEDPQSQAQAAAAPIPPPIIKNTKPSGLKGPKGTAPRTSYSRVNTGAPPTMDAGSTSQKTMPPRGMMFLPSKTAHVEDAMAIMTERPTLQTMVQAAMEGTIDKVDIAKEATIQLAHQYGEEKVAAVQNAQLPTTQIVKLADALSYLAVKVAEGELGPGIGPGTGPGALEVSAPAAAGENIDAGEMGQAIPQDQPPMDPKLEDGALETNEDSMLPPQPVHPMGKVGMAQANMERLSKIGSEELDKATSAPLHLIRKFAEDVEELNKGKGNDTPPDASASEEDVPAQPAQVKMVASNAAATDYTKREAKAEPKKALDHILAEPALSKAHDKTLEKVLDHTEEAGVKISSAMAEDATRIASARALLSKLAADVDGEKKKKEKEKESASLSPQQSLSPGGMGGTQSAAMSGPALGL